MVMGIALKMGLAAFLLMSALSLASFCYIAFWDWELQLGEGSEDDVDGNRQRVRCQNGFIGKSDKGNVR